MPLESAIQAKIIKALERGGWYVIKLIQTNKNGIPDLLCLRNGRAVFIEVKRPGEKPTPLQLQRHRELKDTGFQVEVVNDAGSLLI